MPEPGSSIGPFRIERELGRGGMGIVYLAHDTRLDRRVAIKALPEHVLDDPDRLARFQREAKTLAHLNHPNIGGIHGIEEQGGQHYLILEFVEGPTLADRLENGPIAIDDALDIAAQIAGGLEGAHDAGIIHRDLKPANIKITPDGRVKVLDFGLAKASESTSASSAPQAVQTQSPTVTRRPVHSPTIPGAIMGTAPYMSPEQARGKSVDKRSDIWSYGVVLYEMLTGISPFHGETVSDSIGAILHRDIDLSHLPKDTPGSVRRVISRCLQRDKALRYRDIGDAALDLRANESIFSADGAPGPGARRRFGILVGAVLLLAAVAGWFLRARFIAHEAPPIVRFEIETPDGYTLPSLGIGFPALCVSPSGDTIVFAAESGGTARLFVRDVNTVEARMLGGTENASSPFFSHDGHWLGFFADGHMMKVPIAGGPAVTICDAERSFGVWVDADTIAFSNSRTIMTVNPAGGTPALLASAGVESRTTDGSVAVLGINQLSVVPGAPYLLASVWTGDTLESYAVIAVSVANGSMRLVLNNAGDARFIAPGYLAFLRESSVLAVPFDQARGVATGEAATVVDGVRSTRWADAGFWAASHGGTLAFVPGGRMGPGRRLVRVDASGTSTPLMDGVDSIVGGLVMAPDGHHIALITLRKRVELWSYDLERRSMSLVSAEGESWSPIWTPDSRALIFTQVIPGRFQQVVRKALSTSSAITAEPIGLTTDGDFYPNSITQDSKTLILTQERLGEDMVSRPVIYHMPQGESTQNPAAGQAGGLPEPIPSVSANGAEPWLSPDGRVLAFGSDESGRYEMYVCPFADSGPRVQVSTSGGSTPRWSRDGKHLFFLDRTDVMHSVDVDTTKGLHVSAPTRLFDTKGVASTSVSGIFDVLPDGSFVMVEPAPWETHPARIQVVLNWQEELQAKVTGSTR